MTDRPRLMLPVEVAELLRVDVKTVARWAAAGKLGSVKTLGGHRRYFADEIEAIINTEGGPDAPDPPSSPLPSGL